MVFIVSGKGNVHLISKFKKNEFSSYELFVKEINCDFIKKLELLPAYINIGAIHTPSQVLVDGFYYSTNLCDPGKIGKSSLSALESLIKICKNKKIKTIIIHAAFYDISTQKKEDAIKLLAKRVKPLLWQGVNLCFETDALWFTRFNEKRSLLCEEEDFFKLNFFLDGKLKIAADIEHLYFTFYFTQYLKFIGGELVFLKKYTEQNRKLFQKDMQQFIITNYDMLKLKLNIFTTSFFHNFQNKIEHIHICGSDCYNYIFDPNTKSGLPLIGEHLPLGLREKNISDKLNYTHLIKLLKSLPTEKEIQIVIELWKENTSNFLFEMSKSKLFLITYLNK